MRDSVESRVFDSGGRIPAGSEWPHWNGLHSGVRTIHDLIHYDVLGVVDSFSPGRETTGSKRPGSFWA
jgi:hypothetical protein